MDDEQAPKREPGTIIKAFKRTPLLPLVTSFVYVNSAEIQANNWDVRLVFGERLPNDTSEPRVGLVMSHQHFKAFADAVATQLKALEEVFGKISFLPVDSSAEEK